jgi:YesN/AraC family two-component response regulator
MMLLEDDLIREINCKNKNKAIVCYRELFNDFKKYDFGNGCCFKSIKNHLICLNCILYKNACTNSACKKSVYEKRNSFIKEIEKRTSPEQLYSLGEEIIIFYMNIINSRYVYTKHPIINAALAYIHNHINESLTLKKVAEEIHVSKSHLSNLFPKYIGYSFSYYISKVKVDKSKLLLKNTSLSLLDIAFECGFNSQSYFCYTFKKVEGITPKQYRTKMQ